jgi:hypothetical protein
MELAITTFLAKHSWGVVFLVAMIIVFVFTHIYAKLNDTFSKKETLGIIDLKIMPLVESIDRHSNLIEKQTLVLEKLNDSLQLLHKDMYSVKEKVDKLERPKDD